MSGLVAMARVVVNNSPAQVDEINVGGKTDTRVEEVIRTIGMSRSHPVLLTFLTTFAGLTSILLDKSLQAQFLIPMAIYLGFGVLFATVKTPVLVTTRYMTLEDLSGRGFRIFGRRSESTGEPAEAPTG